MRKYWRPFAKGFRKNLKQNTCRENWKNFERSWYEKFEEHLSKLMEGEREKSLREFYTNPREIWEITVILRKMREIRGKSENNSIVSFFEENLRRFLKNFILISMTEIIQQFFMIRQTQNTRLSNRILQIRIYQIQLINICIEDINRVLRLCNQIFWT